MTEISQSFLLNDTYFTEGFFDISWNLAPHVRHDDGPALLLLGENSQAIEVHVDHRANFDGSPRIIGGAALNEWFQTYWEPDIRILLNILAPDRFQIRRLWNP